MLDNFFKRFHKHDFIRVITFNNDKTSAVQYHASKKYKPSYLINPDHIFLWNGYRTIIIKEGGIETINPLDFESKYDESNFTTAINSKLIRETFTSLKTNKIDLMQIILFLSLAINFVVLYFTLKSNGVF